MDTEWSGLETDARLWCIVARNIAVPEEVFVFEHPEQNPNEFKEFAKSVDLWVGHNLIRFDVPMLRSRFGSGIIADQAVRDTLVISHLLNHNIEGGHSLEAWGERNIRSGSKIKLDKPETFVYTKETPPEVITALPRFIPSVAASGLKTSDTKLVITDFSVWTEEFLRRCISDTLINATLWNHFQKWVRLPAFTKAIEIEHKTAWLCNVLHETGFAIDLPGVKALHGEISDRLSKLDDLLSRSFPPKRVQVGEITARELKNGGCHSVDFRRLVLSGYNESEIVPGRTYPIFEVQSFNAGSHKQIIERLWEAGWSPVDRTDGHKAILDWRNRRGRDPERVAHYEKYGWTLSEDNLATLPVDAPEGAKALTERLMLASRLTVLGQWIDLAVQEPSGEWRIHGNFQGIGAWTQRLSHQRPNMANVPKAKPKDKPKPLDLLSDEINNRMRSLWIAPPGRRLIGVDADGIQMRIFAHYVGDERLIKSLLEGSKENGTDIHSLHKKALGVSCKSRDAAKRFIYAWLLGAGVAKVAEILECSIAEAKEAVASFLSFYPGLRELKETVIPSDAARGYFVGLDGRFVVCDDAHLMLAGYLQNGEALIMKYAMAEWYDALVREGLREWGFINFVHDEWQTECTDTDEMADKIASIQMAAIVHAGEILGLRCPLAGTKVTGYNWKETH